MGCCQSLPRSRPRTTPQTSPYPPSSLPADSSSRAITHPPPSQTVPSPRPSTANAPITPTRTNSHHPAPIGLTESFNSPLRPHVWGSTSSSSKKKRRQWTRPELLREREEYFDTRVSGRQEVWGALRAVSELMIGDGSGDGDTDISTAQGILDASGVTVPTGDLVDGVYDAQGNFYQMPEFVVANPLRFKEGEQQQQEKAQVLSGDGVIDGVEGEPEGDVESEGEVERRREEKGKGVIKSEDAIKVRARLSDRGGADVVVEMGKSQSVRALVRRVMSEGGLPESGGVKIAYLGKILKENETLLAQGWREGHVVNALVF